MMTNKKTKLNIVILLMSVAIAGAALLVLLVTCALRADDFAPGTYTYIDFSNDGFKTDRPSLNLPVFVPADYTPGKAFPLILFSHGSGGTPDTGIMQHVTKQSNYIIVGMEYLRKDESTTRDLDIQLRFNRHVIKRIKEKLNVNSRRIILCGMSRGGFATAGFGFLESEVAIYRAYIVMAGGMSPQPRPFHQFMRDVPVLLVHGDHDTTVAYSYAQTALTTLKAAKADVTLLTMKGVGHTIDMNYAPQMLNWLNEHSADAQLDKWMELALAADPDDLPEAIRYYKHIAGVASIRKVARDAEQRLKQIEDEAGQLLAKAEQAITAKQFDQAIQILKQLSSEYAGTQPADDAEARLEELSEHPQFAEAMRKAEAKISVQRADAALKRARQMIAAKDYPEAVEALDDLIATYPATPAAEQAKAEADALRNDPVIGKQLRDGPAAQDCEGWLSIARNLIKNSRADAARPYLEKVVEQYPDTTYAEQARELLKGLSR